MNYEYDFQGLSGVVSNLECPGDLSTRESPHAEIPQKTSPNFGGLAVQWWRA